MDKHGSDDDEKKDRIALEENCSKLQDLPYDSCLQSEIPQTSKSNIFDCSRRGEQTITTAYS